MARPPSELDSPWYAGEYFVRGVQDTVGVDGFNAIWSSPETLPRAREIEEPITWVRRVHG